MGRGKIDCIKERKMRMETPISVEKRRSNLSMILHSSYCHSVRGWITIAPQMSFVGEREAGVCFETSLIH